MPASGPSRNTLPPTLPISAMRWEPWPEASNDIPTSTIGSTTTSLSPLSMRSAVRAAGGMPRWRSSPRTMTGSVEASAAPRMAAADHESPSSHRAARVSAMTVRSVPGPRTTRASLRCRRTSARSTDTASVKRTRTRLSVATSARIGESGLKSRSPRPWGPSRVPTPRNSATSGRPTRSKIPESDAAVRMTRPRRPSRAAKVAGSNVGIGVKLTRRP
jgi:hypothetical protein